MTNPAKYVNIYTYHKKWFKHKEGDKLEKGVDLMLKKGECDELSTNIIVKNNNVRELKMTNSVNQQTAITKNGLKVIIECPVYSNEDSKIKDEVKVILFNALKEQLKE